MNLQPKKSPAYLFKKLGQYIGLSTVTGDFYSLSKEAYASLKKWNTQASRKENIGKELLNAFPPALSSKKGFAPEKSNKTITDLTLNITSGCNLNCLYCWNEQGSYSNKTFTRQSNLEEKNKYSAFQMSPEIAFRAVDMLVSLSGRDKSLVVDFYGGEPLLNLKTLFATVDYCRTNQARWKTDFYFLLATNGTLLTREVAEKLIKKGVQIAVSIDGPKKVHDHNRPFINDKGSFETIASNLKNLPPDILKRLVGRVTVTPYFSDMVYLYKSLIKIGFERIELFESEDACHGINPKREKSFFNTEEEFKVLCKEYERLALLYIDEVSRGFLDYRKTFFNRFFKLMQRLYYSHQVTGGCPAAKGQIAVDAQGDIYPCTSFLGIDKFKLGDIKRGLDKTRYNSFIKNANQRYGHCQNCPLFCLCRTTGSCLNINQYFNSDPAIPYEKGCRLFRKKLELAMATLAILSEKIPEKLEKLFGFDPVGRRGNLLY